jgi:tetratricopeptide (TPR) repeat protein
MGAPAKDIAAARAAFREGDLALAARLRKRILAAQPRHSVANELMAYVAANQGDLDRAFECLHTATRAPGASATAWYYLGLLSFRAGRLEESETALRRAVELEPAFFEALHDLGRVLHERKDYAGAVEALGRASAARPESFEALHNLGRSLHALERFEDALAMYEKALALKPDSAETWLNRGEALHDMARVEGALESYAKARALRPAFAEAQANEALARIALGDWEAGWEAFEGRWSGAASLQGRHSRIPRWHGERPIAGKRLLVWSEQGFGDTLLFSRFIPVLEAEGAEVVFEVQEPLKPLLERNFTCRVVAVGEEVPATDLQIPAMSLAHAFRVTPENIPGRVPYIHATPEKFEAWRARLARVDAKPKIAVACSGRASYKHEARRSVSLEDFAGLARGAHLFVAQRDLAAADRELIASGRIAAEYLGEEMNDFRDAAGIVANVDLVVTIDTSLGHLAGAMGRPVWILLAQVPESRWMLGRTDTPWYSTARLFRQKDRGDWAGVFGEVERAFEEFSALRRRGG